MKKEKTTRLPFELDSAVDDSLVTSRAGVPLVVELFRASGTASAMDSNVMLKSRDRGLKASEMTECFFSLWSSGGDRCEDFKTLRGDSALYEHEALRYMDDSKIGYAISAVMTAELKGVVESVGESGWRLLAEEAGALREWAEVEFCPDDGDHRKAGPVARRYMAIRIRKRQGHLFADGMDRRHFAVVTNLDWEGGKILEWSRKIAGTVEHVHDVMKNELAGGCFPSGKFGANAAWFRLSAICYNLLSLLKRETLPGEFWTAKPTRLRYLLLNTVGKVVRHARETLLRVCSEALRKLFEMVRTRIYEKQTVLAGD